jgi:hypothetical protein
MSKYNASAQHARIGVIVTSAFVLWACGLQDPNALTSDQIVHLEVNDSVLLADSISRTEVVVDLVGDVPRNSDVKLTTDVGRFAEASSSSPHEVNQKASAGRVSAVFVAPATPGSATITVDVSGYLARRTLVLLPARPVEILLGSDRTSAKATGQEAVTLRARLLRPEGSGVVSLGTRVVFVVRDSLGQELPNLRGIVNVSSIDGVVTHSLTYDQVGRLSVQAIVGEGTEQIRSNLLPIRFAPPETREMSSLGQQSAAKKRRRIVRPL